MVNDKRDRFYAGQVEDFLENSITINILIKFFQKKVKKFMRYGKKLHIFIDFYPFDGNFPFSDKAADLE